MRESITVRTPEAWPRVMEFLQRQKIPEGGLEVEVRTPRRTSAQNRYLWGVVYKTIADHLIETKGQLVSPEDVHYICREHFMPRVKFLDKSRPMSTTELEKSGEFSDYIEKIYEMAAKMGCYVPSPGEC